MKFFIFVLCLAILGAVDARAFSMDCYDEKLVTLDEYLANNKAGDFFLAQTGGIGYKEFKKPKVNNVFICLGPIMAPFEKRCKYKVLVDFKVVEVLRGNFKKGQRIYYDHVLANDKMHDYEEGRTHLFRLAPDSKVDEYPSIFWEQTSSCFKWADFTEAMLIKRLRDMRDFPECYVGSSTLLE